MDNNNTAVECKLEVKQIPYKESKLTRHQLYMQEIETDINTGKISIWSMDYFPYTWQPYSFTPQQLKAAIIEYSDSPTSINKICNNNNVPYKGFWDMVEKYPEARDLWQSAFTRKAKEYNKQALELYSDETPPDWAKDTTVTSGGAESTRWSGAAVQFMRNKADLLMRQAVIHDRATYGDKQTVEMTTTNRNINANISITTDTQGMIDLFSSNK